MFTNEWEAQQFEEWERDQIARRLEVVACDAEKRGKRIADWALVAAACLVLAASNRPDSAIYAKEARKYSGYSRPDHLEAAKAELVELAERRAA